MKKFRQPKYLNGPAHDYSASTPNQELLYSLTKFYSNSFLNNEKKHCHDIKELNKKIFCNFIK